MSKADVVSGNPSPQWWREGHRKRDVLVRRRRLRRDLAMPVPFDNENERRVRYPHRLPAPPGYSAVYRRTAWRAVGESEWWDKEEDEDAPEFARTRATFAWVLQGDRRVAGLHLNEFDFGLAGDEFIFQAMDSESHEFSSLAQLLLLSWEGLSIETTISGPIIELSTVWADPRHAPPGVWKRPLQGLLQRARRRGSLVVAHAFPLEYTGLAPEGAPARMGFQCRVRAMRRLGERWLGLQAFPGLPGEQGWMWAGTSRARLSPPALIPGWHL